MQSEVKQFCAQSRDFFASSAMVFRTLEGLPPNLVSLQNAIAEQTIENTEHAVRVIGSLDAISSDSKALIYQSHTIATRLQSLESQVSRSIRALISIAKDIKNILSKLQAFSKDCIEIISANGYVELISEPRNLEPILQSQAFKRILTLTVFSKEEAA